jgi:hypothetical protein
MMGRREERVEEKEKKVICSVRILFCWRRREGGMERSSRKTEG